MSEKIDIYTEIYTKYVIQKLVGIKGKSESEVAGFIIKEWIGDHIEELEKLGINAKKAKEGGVIEE